MKYDYIHDKDVKVIENYEIKKNQLIVHYINDDDEILENTEENIAKVRSIMFDQMNEKIKLGKEGIIDSLDLVDYTLLVLMLDCAFKDLNYLLTKFDHRVLRTISLILAVFVLRMDGEKLFAKSGPKKELEKLRLYSSMLERLNEIDPELIFDKGEEPLDINTIDDYSLREVKQINDKIYKLRKKYGNPYDNTLNIIEKETIR